MSKRDLFVAVADLDQENAIKTLLLKRQPAMDVRLTFDASPPPQGDLLRYRGRDSGCYRDAVDLLRPPQQTHRHAMLIFDREGCGVSDKSREEIESEVENSLCGSGWRQGSVAVVVIDPELEAWVWSESPHVPRVLGWAEDAGGLRSFLRDRSLWDEGLAKPADPKEALVQALRRKKRAKRTARLFAELASRVRVQDCQDPAFRKFRETLRRWFPRSASVAG